MLSEKKLGFTVNNNDTMIRSYKIKISSFLPVGLLVALLISCGQKKLQPGDYVRWVENEKNGLKQEKNIGEIIYTAQFKPLDYIVTKEMRSNAISAKELEARKKELNGMEYFNLRLSAKDKTTEVLTIGTASENEYLERSNYFSYAFQQDIKLIQGKDTIPCTLFNNVRNYGLAPYMDFVVGFEDKNILHEESQQTLLIHDNQLGGGLIKIEIDNADILHAPELKTL